MTRPDEIAALADVIERRKDNRPRDEYAPLVHTHEVDTVISALRLSATSPGDAVREGWTGKKCPYCKGTGENLSNPMSSGSCQHCGGTGDEYAALARAEKAGDELPPGYSIVDGKLVHDGIILALIEGRT